MDVENDTNEPVDYDQSGSGGGDEEEFPGQGQGNCSGRLNANGGKATFTPCGRPPWTVSFTDDQGNSCTSPSFSNASATVKLNGIDPCNVSVS